MTDFDESHKIPEKEHQLCEDQLPYYIDLIRTDGLPEANQRLPKVIAHLNRCPACREVFRASKEILDAQASGELPNWPQATKPPEGEE